MGITCPLRGLVIPDHRYLRMDAPEAIRKGSIAINMQLPVYNIFLQVFREVIQSGNPGKHFCIDNGWPPFGLQDLDLIFIIYYLFRETFPLNQVNQVGGNIHYAFTLLVSVKCPGRTDKGIP